MTTDREMLELAAKAAGIAVVGDVDRMIIQPDHRTGGFIIRNDRGGDSSWNPLTDDGDALRLAVQLGLQVTPGTYNKEEATAYRSGMAEANERVHYQQDICAATRRAIVRAAAEIGRAMP